MLSVNEDVREQIQAYKYILVMPCFNDYNSLDILLANIKKTLVDNFYVVVVDDGSREENKDITVLEKNATPGTILSLKRNVGHQHAIFIGIKFIQKFLSNTQKVIVMDCDGEDAPESIPKLISTHQEDIVVAQRNTRSEGMLFKIFYKIYKFFFKLLTGHAISWGNFMCLSPGAARRLSVMPEARIHLASAILLTKLSYCLVPIDRAQRYIGTSKMSFVSLISHGLTAIMNLADNVFVRILFFCCILSALCICGIFILFLRKFLGYTIIGWASSMIGICFTILMQSILIAFFSLSFVGIMKLRSKYASGDEKLIDTIFTFNQ